MSDQKAIYVAYEANYGENALGEDLPAAAMLRLNQESFRQLDSIAKEIERGAMTSAEIPLLSREVVWLEIVGFRQDNSLGGVPGFFDPSKDRLLNSNQLLRGVLEMEIDEEVATFADHSVPFNIVVKDPVMEFFFIREELYVGLAGDLGGRRLGTICSTWESLRAACQEAGLISAEPETGRLEIDGAFKATLLAALQHYIETGQGDPANRTDLVHALACGPDDSVISLDDDGVRALMAHVQAVAPVQEQPSDVRDGEAYFENRVVVTVLSQDTPLGEMSLADVAEAITTGDCVGSVSFAPAVRLSGAAMAQRLYDLGSEPGFFGLDDDGEGEGERPERSTESS